MDLAAVKDFVAVVREGSFAAASRTTQTPKSTLSKRVGDLEAFLGVRLLERTTRKLRLTREGQLFFERARRLVTDAQELERLMRDRDETPRGTLRVAVSVLFGHAFMGSLAANYVRRWPETTLDVVFTDSYVDLIAENFDCAIRAGQVSDSSFIGRTFAQSQSVVVGNPELLETREPPSTPSELHEWPTLGVAAHGRPCPWILERNDETLDLSLENRLTLGSLYAVRDAARKGAGLALIPEFLVAPDLQTGALRRVLDGWRGPLTDLRIIYPSRRHLSGRVRAFIETVTSAFAGRSLSEMSDD